MESTSPYPGLGMHSCGFWGRESEFPCRMWPLVGQPHIWRMIPHPGVPRQTNYKEDTEVGMGEGIWKELGEKLGQI